MKNEMAFDSSTTLLWVLFNIWTNNWEIHFSYTGELCDTKILIIEAICHKNKPCVNDGICLNGFCQCPTNFTGDLCESRVDPTTSSLIHTDKVSLTIEFLLPEGAGATMDNAEITMHNTGVT